MKSFILMALLTLGHASGSMNQDHLKERTSLSEVLAKCFQTELPPRNISEKEKAHLSEALAKCFPHRNTSDLTNSHIEPDDSNVEFLIDFSFNLIGFVFPPGALIQNLFQLIRPNTGPSVWDQIKDKVKAVVTKGVTNYHRDSLYVKIKVLESRFDSIWKLAVKYHPSQFLTETVQLHTDMFNSRLEF